jgi:hypothetical protein
MTQWHPIFAQLLRPAVEAYYEVQTTVPVGDAPREADFVLLRRTAAAPPPLRGLWRHLTSWNILEFKGPSISPRRGNVELLVELGLGIDRQLRTQRPRQPRGMVRREEVSFWYLANHLGRRWLQDAAEALGGLEPLGPGLWRSRALGHVVWLVGSIDLPVEEDSLPLHLVSHEPLDTERQVARLVLEQPELQERYAGWLASLHPTTWKEIEAMAKAARKALQIDLRPAIESLGLKHVLEQVGIGRVVSEVGIGRVVSEVGIGRVVSEVGISRVLDEVGPDQVLSELGDKEVVRRLGLNRILASLSPAERRELKRRLQ